MKHIERELFNLNTELPKLKAVFSRELTPDLAEGYIVSLVERLGGLDQHPAEFVEKGKVLHYTVGKDIYGPLITGYCQWLATECEKLNFHGNVFFALRDAAPLEVAAVSLWDKAGLTPVGIYINRPLLGIEDEITPEESTQNGKVMTYLEKKGLMRESAVVWADSGAWGTVIKVMKSSMLKHHKLYPFFWYSHNPYIPGYLNQLLPEAGVEDKFGEILNDSMECMFPQKWLRPLQIRSDSSDVVLAPSSYLARVWGQAALDGVQSAASTLNGTIDHDQQIQEIVKLKDLCDRAKQTGQWTGVLSTNTPTWSHGKDYITQWPAGLLP